MGTPRWCGAAASVTYQGQSGVLAMGGAVTGNDILASAEFFNPATNTWVSVASMANPRTDLCAAPVSIGGVTGVLAIGGASGSPTPSTAWSAEFWNPITNAWTTIASMNTPRLNAAAVPVTYNGGAGVLVMGGRDINANVLPDAEFFYPPTNNWNPVSPMIDARSGFAAAPLVVSGVAGIVVASGAGSYGHLSTVEFWNPVTNSWRELTPISTPKPLSAGAPVTISGTSGMIVVGGSQPYPQTAVGSFFDPIANQWTPIAPMNVARYCLAAAPVSVNLPLPPTPTPTATMTATPSPTLTPLSPVGSIYPNPFHISQGDVHFMIANHPGTIIRLFNVSGELIARLAATDTDVQAGYVKWAGRTAQGNLVAVGIYEVIIDSDQRYSGVLTVLQ